MPIGLEGSSLNIGGLYNFYSIADQNTWNKTLCRLLKKFKNKRFNNVTMYVFIPNSLYFPGYNTKQGYSLRETILVTGSDINISCFFRKVT